MKTAAAGKSTDLARQYFATFAIYVGVVLVGMLALLAR